MPLVWSVGGEFGYCLNEPGVVCEGSITMTPVY